MIHVIATIDLVEGQRAAFLKEFHALVPLVRAEAGCLEYGPAIDAEGHPRISTAATFSRKMVLKICRAIGAAASPP